MPTKSKARSAARKEKGPSPLLKKLTAEKGGSLKPEDSVETAGRRMREYDAENWPVTKDRKLVGEIERRNPDWQLSGHGHDPKAWSVGEIMSRELIFCFEDESCDQARRVMKEHNLSYLPVVDREMHIVGIFSRGEIEKADP